MYRSPNGTIRNILDGTSFLRRNVPRLVPRWTQPIVIGRHAYGDIYRATEIKIPGPGKVTLCYQPAGGPAQTFEVHDFNGGGAAIAMRNTEGSITGFARASFNYALLRGWLLYFSTKNTILEAYDGYFMDIFRRIYETEFEAEFDKKGLTCEHRRIDDMVACALKWDGRHVWACTNYDGGVCRRTARRWRARRRTGHGDAALLAAPEGPAEVHQSDRVDPRLGARADLSWAV
jgi:isocitrate dehydrogenase